MYIALRTNPGCRRGLAGLLVIAALALPGTARASSWQHVVTEDGITVTSREVPGRDFPTFRGVGVVHGSIYEVLAVLKDIGRYSEWMERAKNGRLLKQINELEYVVYGCTDAPWPVSDRDAVYQSKTIVDLPKMTVTVNFWAVKSKVMPPQDGIVRMEKLRGHFKFKALDERKTRVEYQADADPAGMLPTWVAKLATKKLPLATLQGLRRQVKRTRGWYERQIKAWKQGKY